MWTTHRGSGVKTPRLFPPERVGEGRPGRLQDGYKLLAGEVFAVEFQQAVRVLDHTEAVGNEAVL